MGRPKRIGIDYFSFDVDFFEDEKVLPVSVEFGAKGEMVVIRLLCAIYREGYFLQWSDGLKFKIANQTKVGEQLVTDVVLKLVKYRFFNEEIFTQHQILTSQGIQKRWNEATRKRVDLNEKEYWILDDKTVSGGRNPVSGGRKAEESTENDPESTQSKVKESKGINNPPLLPPKGDNVEPPPVWKKDFKVYLKELREEFKRLSNDKQWIKKQEEFNPGVDILKSIEKSCVNYWLKKLVGEKRKGHVQLTLIGNQLLPMQCQ